MALKDTWVDKVDDVDDVEAEIVNDIAHAIIELEEETEGIETLLADIQEVYNEYSK